MASGFPASSTRGRRGPWASPRAPSATMARKVRKTSGGAIGPIAAGTPFGVGGTWPGGDVARRNADVRVETRWPTGRSAFRWLDTRRRRRRRPARPSGQFNSSAGDGRPAIGWPERPEMSQTRAVASALAETTERPSRVKAMALTPARCPSKPTRARGPRPYPKPGRSRRGSTGCSPLPEARNRPSGENASPRVPSSRPVSVATSRREATSIRRIEQSSIPRSGAFRPPRARSRPSGERAIA